MPDVIDTSALPVRLASEIDYLAGRTDRWTATAYDHPNGVRARALVVAGRIEEARLALAALAETGVRGPQDALSAIWALSRVGGLPVSALVPFEDGPEDEFLAEDGVPLGPRALAAGLRAVAAGDLEEASRSLEAAVAVGDSRAPLWGALCRVELSRLRWTQADVLERTDPVRVATMEQARRLGLAARIFFVSGGYRHLVGTTSGLFGDAEMTGAAEPRVGFMVEGDGWTVGFGAVPPVRVPASKGLVALRVLLSTSDGSVTAAELDQRLDGIDPDVRDRAVLLAAVETGTVDAHDLRSHLLDPRSRSRISKLITRTIQGLGSAHPVLGRHLAATVSTGYVCRYGPDPGVSWQF